MYVIKWKIFNLVLKIKVYNSIRKNICINLSDDRSIVEKEKNIYILIFKLDKIYLFVDILCFRKLNRYYIIIYF